MNDISTRRLEESVHIGAHHFFWALNMARVLVRFIWNPVAPDVGIWSFDRHQKVLQFCKASKSVFVFVCVHVWEVCAGISASNEVLNYEAFE